jgi:hypothetical protein
MFPIGQQSGKRREDETKKIKERMKGKQGTDVNGGEAAVQY